jgi:hypothetical protein
MIWHFMNLLQEPEKAACQYRLLYVFPRWQGYETKPIVQLR